MTDFLHLLQTPCDTFFVQCPPEMESYPTGIGRTEIPTALFRRHPRCEFRGVSLDRLRAVLQNGIDVLPTTSVIYVANAEKAMEYGDWPKILLALDYSRLKPTFRELSSGIAEAELAAIRSEYPNIFRSKDGSKIWCTRLDGDDCRIATDYETHYARWISGDPWEALKAIYLLARPQDVEILKSFLEEAKRGTPATATGQAV